MLQGYRAECVDEQLVFLGRDLVPVKSGSV